MIPIIKPGDKRYNELIQDRAFDLEQVEATVSEIINAVRTGGDKQLCAVTARLDGIELEPAQLPVAGREIEAAYEQVDEDFLTALRLAAANITRFHRRQLRNSWFEPQPDGSVLGQVVSPLRRVGIYVPGGKASYPSSVLMNAIPAAVAGVKEIVMVTPPGRDGTVNPYTLVAAAEAGVTEIYRVGGAQAVAALAYGTATIGKVDKITGPGNIYVTAAKRQVFGVVDIDMLAGPSEVLIVADGSARPEFIAADMLAQAEHDEMASAILVTTDRELAEQVNRELTVQLNRLNRREVAAASLTANGAIILTTSLDEALEVANSFAPEHMELMVAEPFPWLGRVTAAGAVFLGHFAPEAVGDYIAGPNHVLPTGGTARFFSPLNVDTFMKKTSIIGYSEAALKKEGARAVLLAETEGLDAHAASITVRLKSQPARNGRQVQNNGMLAGGNYRMPPFNHAGGNSNIDDTGLRNLPGMKTLKPGFGDLHKNESRPERTKQHAEKGEHNRPGQAGQAGGREDETP